MENKITFLLFLLISFSWNNGIDAQKLYQVSNKEAGTTLGTSVMMILGGELIEHRRGDITVADIDNLNSSSILGFDSKVVENFSDQASRTSDIFKDGILVVPFSFFLASRGRENAREIFLMYCEVGAINFGLTRLVKGATGRYRPYAYNPDVDLSLKLSPTTRRSFFSGHVSHVTSLSFFTASIFEDLYPDSNMKYVVWTGALAAPAITAYLRVKAGRHFISDVVVGYAVGGAIGYLVPRFHKTVKDHNIDIIGAEGGLGMIYTF